MTKRRNAYSGPARYVCTSPRPPFWHDAKKVLQEVNCPHFQRHMKFFLGRWVPICWLAWQATEWAYRFYWLMSDVKIRMRCSASTYWNTILCVRFPIRAFIGIVQYLKLEFLFTSGQNQESLRFILARLEWEARYSITDICELELGQIFGDLNPFYGIDAHCD